MLVILLPVFNEEESLPELLPKLATWLAESGLPARMIVGDDGSSDGTLALLTRYSAESPIPIEILQHPYNRGLGETSRDLFERAAETASPNDTIIRMDCDNTHEPEFIGRMLAKLDEGFDVVIASRFQPGGGQRGVNLYRASMSRFAGLFMKVLFPIPGVWEYSCGFRAYRAAIIQDAIQFYQNNFIQLTGLGFTCTVEKLIKLKLRGARFAEVPFILRYDQKQSESKMVASITTLGYVTLAILYHWPWGGWRRAYRQGAPPARPRS